MPVDMHAPLLLQTNKANHVAALESAVPPFAVPSFGRTSAPPASTHTVCAPVSGGDCRVRAPLPLPRVPSCNLRPPAPPASAAVELATAARAEPAAAASTSDRVDGDRTTTEPHDWVDIDALNADDPLAVPTYAQDISAHLRASQLTKRPSASYLERVQIDVNAKMRAILVDWLVEVAEEYTLCADTLYQAVGYIDRYLSTAVTKRSQLQLVGVTCVWLASKYEEIYPPTVADFWWVADREGRVCAWWGLKGGPARGVVTQVATSPPPPMLPMLNRAPPPLLCLCVQLHHRQHVHEGPAGRDGGGRTQGAQVRAHCAHR
jgi:hypothetical protein